jgi:hypothetical protein
VHWKSKSKFQINVIGIKVYNDAENALEITGKIRITALGLKGTVQRKLTGVESDINRKVYLSH